MKVLVVDDNPQMLQQLSDLLEKEGYKTIRANNGREALDAYKKEAPDFICIDIMMPEMTGYEVCKEIRKNDMNTPVVFISAKSDTVDKVLGLELGADDYIVKPYDIHEVTARIRTITRRCKAKAAPEKQGEEFQFADVKIFPNQLRAEREGKPIELSMREVKIIRLFYQHKGNVIDRDILLDHCWGAHIMPESRTVDWHISQLRKKIEKDPLKPTLIKTVHGAGYKFEDSR